jgi:pimeloyl-ACP methyl ester carboxylesterase
MSSGSIDNEVRVEVSRRGSGRAVVVLGGLFGVDGGDVWDGLVGCEVFVVSLPGFGGADRPDWCDSVTDLVLMVADWVESEKLVDVCLVGCSFGGWVAAELAVRRPGWLGSVVLVDGLGVRPQGEETDRNFADVFALSWAQVCRQAFADVELGERLLGIAGRDADGVLGLMRCQEAVAVYGWRPYLHDPKLERRLARVGVPVLVVWGEQDRIALPVVGQTLAERIPGARLVMVPGAGHLPHVERPEEFVDVVAKFLKLASAEVG